MNTRVRKEPAMVYANVGVHADVEITLAVVHDYGEGASIHFGGDGPDLSIDFADLDSLERLAAVAAEGARRLRERIEPNRSADCLAGAGAAS